MQFKITKKIVVVPIELSRRWGFDPQIFFRALASVAWVRLSKYHFKRQWTSSEEAQKFRIGKNFYIGTDRYESAGETNTHYFLQDLIVARAIYKANPKRHIDVGSRIDGFVAHLASFRDVEVIDIRKLDINIPGITFLQMDLMVPLTDIELSDSVSCLHALEHFGLGRYGDQLDTGGWLVGLENLRKLIKPGGRLYLSVPTGWDQRIEFNAHRVFAIPFLTEVLQERFEVERVEFIDDLGNVNYDVDLESEDALRSFNASYGCSIWTLKVPISVV